MTDGPATGSRLKTQRESRGLSSQKAADELHLDSWVIDALEAGDYARVGPSVYVKGHLKRYAALLGLPVAEVMASYEARAQTPQPPASPPAAVRLLTGNAPAATNLPWPHIAGAVAVVLMVFAVLWWKPWHQRGARPAPPASVAANPTAASADSTMDSAAAAGAPPTAAPVLPGAAAAVSPAPPAAPEPDATAGMGRARLHLSFSADSWVDVHDAAGRRVFAGNGLANSVKTITGTAPLRVYLGVASGVQLEINSRVVAIGPQFVAGDVARFEAGADGVLRRDSHSAAAAGVTPPRASPRNARPTG